MSSRKSDSNTFGFARAEVVGALVNAVFLLALCFSITVQALKRFTKPEPINDPRMILIVGGVGLLINIIGLVIFGHSHDGVEGHGHSHGQSSNQEDSQASSSASQMNIKVR